MARSTPDHTGAAADPDALGVRKYAHILWVAQRGRYEIHAQTTRNGTKETDDVLQVMPMETVVITLSQARDTLIDVRLQAGGFDVTPTRARRNPLRYQFRTTTFAPEDVTERTKFEFQPWVLTDKGDWLVVSGPENPNPLDGEEVGHVAVKWVRSPPGSIVFPP